MARQALPLPPVCCRRARCWCGQDPYNRSRTPREYTNGRRDPAPPPRRGRATSSRRRLPGTLPIRVVLTAATASTGPGPRTINVDHVLGGTEETHRVPMLLTHRDVAVALVRLSTPLQPGVATFALHRHDGEPGRRHRVLRRLWARFDTGYRGHAVGLLRASGSQVGRLHAAHTSRLRTARPITSDRMTPTLGGSRGERASASSSCRDSVSSCGIHGGLTGATRRQCSVPTPP